MRKLILLRHGQSQWNLENRFTGFVDVDLSALGVKEAKEAGERLKGVRVDRAFTSALKRAQRTLALALEAMGQGGVPVEKDAAINERHYGDLQGLDKAETARKYGDRQVHVWRRSYDVRPPGGESLADTAARALPYFKARILPEVLAGRTVLVSAHGNSLRAIVMELDGLSKDEVMELNIPTGVPIVYEFDAKGKVLRKETLEAAPKR